MYAVVGCRDCGAYWIVAGRPETTQCRRCGARRRFEQLHRFAETDDEDAAREARARLLAERSSGVETVANLDSFAAMDDRVREPAVSDEAYLTGVGVDADAVAAAGERATARRNSQSRREIVVAAVRALEDPTVDAIVAYARERGVATDDAREVLERLTRRGAATRSGDWYRLL